VFVSFEMVRVPAEECATTVCAPKKRNVAAFPLRLWEMIMSAKLVDWFVNRANSQLPQVSGRGTKRQDFDASEIAAIHRMLVGYFNTSELGWDEYLRSKDRLGFFMRDDTIRCVSKKWFDHVRQSLLVSGADVHQLFEIASEGLRSVVQIPHQTGTAELALDESMLTWSNTLHKWVVYLPRKPEPLGMRAYLLAMKLYVSRLPVVLHAFPDMFDQAFWKPQVCCPRHCDSNEWLFT
jgi:hypothetical protein